MSNEKKKSPGRPTIYKGDLKQRVVLGIPTKIIKKFGDKKIKTETQSYWEKRFNDERDSDS